jgi:hypothetical protein
MIQNAKLRCGLFFALLILIAFILCSLHSVSAQLLPANAPQGGAAPAFPLKPGSVRFAVIGDSGAGNSFEYDVAEQMVKARQAFPFDFVVMLGDNINQGHSQRAFAADFEQPYHLLLDAGVKFYASLGNHDDPIERFYKPFNMGGQRYYAYSKGNARFIVLDSNYMDSPQLEWLRLELSSNTSPWKIVYFHHPLYSNGRFHGPDTDLRSIVEPLFEKYGVNVVLSGHEHVYERILPQHGIYYFILGNAGELRPHNLKASPEMAAGFDEDRAFMLIEVTGDDLYFQTISRTGAVVDSGALPRQQKPTQP